MQINKHVHAIKVPFYIVNPPRTIIERSVYVYLIYGTNNVFLIDTGVASSETAIFDYLKKTERRPENIGMILQTHSHPDHIGSTRTIKGETACAVAIHPAEKQWLENVQLQAEERPVPGFDSLVSGSVAVNRLLEDGEVFDLGCGLKLQIFHTPGHSKGSISILLLGYMALFSGDSVPVPNEIPVYEDVKASVASIKKLLAVRDVRYLLPAWDEPAKGDEVYKRLDAGLNYLQQIHEIVLSLTKKVPEPDPMELCRKAFVELGLHPETANPIAARSFMAHLKLRNKKSII